MADILNFELVSPEKLQVSKSVAMVTVPGGEGEYGVLPGHAPMITTVKPGVIGIYANAGDTAPDEKIFVAGGFAETTPTRCTILADEAMPVAELNRGKLEEAAKTLAEKINYAMEPDLAPLLAQQAIIAAKIQAAA